MKTKKCNLKSIPSKLAFSKAMLCDVRAALCSDEAIPVGEVFNSELNIVIFRYFFKTQFLTSMVLASLSKLGIFSLYPVDGGFYVSLAVTI